MTKFWLKSGQFWQNSVHVFKKPSSKNAETQFSRNVKIVNSIRRAQKKALNFIPRSTLAEKLSESGCVLWWFMASSDGPRAVRERRRKMAMAMAVVGPKKTHNNLHTAVAGEMKN